MRLYSVPGKIFGAMLSEVLFRVVISTVVR